ncbi:SesB-related regulatory protein [Lasiodiplodia theobromae]|uniref:SesB-related regulatory protein n=1 Tax=Lasiodiplodia theobromae TaxID=45133 RepID=UPI0015C3B8AC|nr:SesB-related regulatory protein [Lasiodiplodia theobromae]KAF4546069.1 SesB-related regulatory protein [Lasiodiplodia theobromae]
MRSETDTEERPIVFVAHSLGGLVVEQALLISRGSSELHVKDILEGTFAIVFMGTPHHGSNLANWRIHLTRLSSLIMQTNKKIVRVLDPGSEVLANIQQEFHTMIRDRVQHIQKDVQIFCFYEEKQFRGIGKIVDDHSSILASYPNASIHANHVSMTKFNGSVDAGYVRVKGRLKLWAKTIREAQQKAEGHQKVAEEQPSRKDGQDDEDDDGSRGGNLLEFNGPVSSNGGPIFQGYYRSGRDMVYSNVQKET